MKMLVLSGSILFSTITAMAQQKEPATKKAPVITKGYYSIGNHAQKLITPSEPVLVTEVTAKRQKPVKGYFAIGTDSRKMAAQTKVISSKKKPVITKGYYSIGNNAEKLKH